MHDPTRELERRLEQLQQQVAQLEARRANAWPRRLLRWLARPRNAAAVALASALVPLATWAAVVVPNVFVNGTVADANQVNQNFSALADEINLHETIPGAHHVKTTDASELVAGVLADARLSTNVSLLGAAIEAAELGFDPATQAELDAHAAVPGVHHARYTNLEAIAAVGPHVTSVGGLTGGAIAGDVDVAGFVSSTTSGFRFPDATVQTTAARGSEAFPNRLLVAPSGGDFTSIQAAIDAIAPTEADPYLIDVAPGVYTENLTLKSWVHLRGAGIGGTVLVAATGSSAHLQLTSLSGVKVSQLSLYDDPVLGPVIGAGIEASASELELVDVEIEGYSSFQVRLESASRLEARRVHFANGLQNENGLSISASDAFVDDSDFGTQSCGIDLVVGNLELRNSRMATVADAFDVCATNAGRVLLSGNQLAKAVRVANADDLQLLGNRIDQWVDVSNAQTRIVGNWLGASLGGVTETVLHVSGGGGGGAAKIVGNTIWGGGGSGQPTVLLEGGPVTVSGNRIEGTAGSPALVNRIVGALVIANEIAGGATGIVDEGAATIVGNTIRDATLGLDLSASTGTSLAFGNRILGSTGLQAVESWVTDRGIRVESTADAVTIAAGGSTLTLAANGDVTLESAGDLDLSGTNVTIDATAGFTVTAGTQANISSVGPMALSGAIIDLN